MPSMKCQCDKLEGKKITHPFLKMMKKWIRDNFLCLFIQIDSQLQSSHVRSSPKKTP